MIAREGEIVTCALGHPLYRLTQDIYPHSTFRAEYFERIDPEAQDPEHLQPIEGCPHCGACWIDFMPGSGIHLHISNEWRPRLDS